MTGTRDWDAGTYHRVSGPQVDWARGVIDRLVLAGGETVLDAGCGSGRVTAMLLDELPDGGVVAVDGSASMIREARARLDPARSRTIESDLLDLELEEEVDAVFSNAVFHWIDDHDRLFAVLRRALRPGGRFEAQCGGEGNVARFYAALREVAALPPFAEHLAGFEPNHFASAGATEARLRRAGFSEVRCWLQEWPARPPEPREYLRSVCLGAHSERLPEELREGLVDQVAERLGPDLELDYVRLNISAGRGAAPA